MRDLVTVFGGTGFLGAQIVRALARAGWRIRVAARNPGRGYRLPMLGDVGQIAVAQANIRDRASVERALEGATACVNAVGILYETGRQSFQAIHGEGAARVAEAARAAGARRHVLISAIGADPGSASAYARGKAAGEAAARRAFPDAVILRPSVIFGPEDSFFNRFAAMAQVSPVLPLIGGGGARLQPVYVGDVAKAVAAALALASAERAAHELGGPRVYTFREAMELMLRVIGRRRFLAPVPFRVAGGLAALGEAIGALTPFSPPLTRDQLRLLRLDNVVSPAAPGLAELGVIATPAEPILPTYLYRFRPGGQYAGLAAGESADLAVASR